MQPMVLLDRIPDMDERDQQGDSRRGPQRRLVMDNPAFKQKPR